MKMEQILKDNELVLSVRFAEIDMIRVVHHSRYWIWFEEGRFNFLNKVLNITTDDVLSSGIFLPVIDCKCTYISSVKWGDKVKVITRIDPRQTAYLVFNHEVYILSENKSRLACKASIKHAFVDKDFNLKLRMPSFIERTLVKNRHKGYAFVSKGNATF